MFELVVVDFRKGGYSFAFFLSYFNSPPRGKSNKKGEGEGENDLHKA